MNFTLLSEASPAEMTEALRWISFLKPYMKQATVGKAKRYIAQLRQDVARAKKGRPDINSDPLHYLESNWYRILLYVPKDAMAHLLPSKDLSFHTDDEFDDSGYESRDYAIEIRPDKATVETTLPVQVPPLAQRFLLQAAADFKEELKSLIEHEA